MSDTHDGYELYVNYGRLFRRQRWFVEPSIGASYKSADMNDYYWGVRPEESNLALPEHQVSAGWNLHARLATTYQLTRNWSFTATARYERLSSEAWGSLLLAERSVKSAFVGSGSGSSGGSCASPPLRNLEREGAARVASERAPLRGQALLNCLNMPGP